MNANPFSDPLHTLRTALEEIDREPEPLTPELKLLRELLDTRLRRLEIKSNGDGAAIHDDSSE